MKTNIATKLGLSLFALGLAASPVMAQTAAMPAEMPAHKGMPAHKAMPAHKDMHAKAAKPAPLSATDQLNAQSLSAAQAGKEYMPVPAASPAAAPMKKKM